MMIYRAGAGKNEKFVVASAAVTPRGPSRAHKSAVTRLFRRQHGKRRAQPLCNEIHEMSSRVSAIENDN